MSHHLWINLILCLALVTPASPGARLPDACSAITIGQLVNGTIAVSGETDCYTLIASAGQTIYFDAISSSELYTMLSWRLVNSVLAPIFTTTAFDDRQVTLSSGTYTLTVDGDGDTTSSYSFKLYDVPPPDQFAIAIGDLVSNGVPEAGAGNLETPGVQDRYTFTAAAGQTVYFDKISSSELYTYLSWQLVNPSSQVIFDSDFEDQHLTLAQGGTYTLTVDGDGDSISIYSFKLYNVPPVDQFAIAIGDLVENGVPGAEAGSLETPGVQDRYTFTAAAGQRIFFDARGSSELYTYLSWRLENAASEMLFESDFVDQTRTLAAGQYTLTVDGDGDTTSTYKFRITDVNVPDWSPLEVGEGHESALVSSGDSDSYSVAAAAGQFLSIKVTKSSAWYGSLYVRRGAHPTPGAYDVRSYRISGDQEITIPATQAGTYYILFQSGDYYPDYGSYTITARLITPEPLALNSPQSLAFAAEEPRIFRVNLPSGAPNLFARLQKSTGWGSEFRLFKGSDELFTTSGAEDPLHQAAAPTAGTYYIIVSGVGQGILTASTTLPALSLGAWKTGSILRRWGSAWYQLQVPAAQSTLNLRAEALGLYSQLQLFRGSFNSPPVGFAAGSLLQVAVSAPPAGLYYVHLSDSATVVGANQERDHMLQAASTAIAPPPCAGPVIGDVTPTQGGASGLVTVKISGLCLAPEAAVCLKRSGSSVCASEISGSDDRRRLTAMFNLASAAPGNWSLQVTNPGQSPLAAPVPFVVQEQGEPRLWVEVTGREQIRIGRFTTYHVEYGNSGPVDAFDVILNVYVPAGWEVEWDMPHPDHAAINWDEYTGAAQTGEHKVIPLWFLKVGAGSQAGFDFKIKIPQGSPGERVQIKAQIIQVDSTFARSGDFNDVQNSPILDALVQSLYYAYETAYQEYHNRPGEIALPVQDLPPIERIHKNLFDHLIGEYQPLSQEGVIGIAVMGVFALMIGGELLPFMLLGMEIGDLVGFAMDRYDLEQAKADALQDADDLLEGMPIQSVSPEDKFGPSGYDPAGAALTQLKRWIPAGGPIHYQIDFWNKEDAPAATQDVIITDQLDPDLDWSSFRFTEVGFLDWRAAIEPTQDFSLDISPASINLGAYYPGQPVVSLVVHVTGAFDPSTGAIEWQYHALDPLTRDYPENPFAGFLPPYTASGWEIGWANFTVSPKAGATSGTAVTNQAFVKFDLNPFNPAPKAGPFRNTLDAVAPSATVKTPAGSQACSAFMLTWSAQDDAQGSGVGGVDIYADNLDDAAPPSLWLAGTLLRRAVFQGKPGARYGFFALAWDNAGNREAMPATVKYEVQARAGLVCLFLPLARKTAR